ncbi:hypothetical protein BIV57_06605 [Mangrovactinospora gilvigrisea]|uniref:SMP-30/Gluconolactonase/LRE-like region domain-containing protein n=1 Tax=Mangrovactinospora gilvigrisea TaxID=1428644 RepID=A0A1J7C9Y0_9ACTN|nr:SMP-30/gluconolactonase/LRE family protein [Mangrovactinospora gilvigrisea]OIV38324.1 hypothetical protein BIV57_06605 [Mangrovactinospora gilvigrisea]
MSKAEQITGADAYHGEGPCWYDGWGGLRWVDMLAGCVLSLDAGHGTVRRHPTASRVAAVVRPRARGGSVLALERGFAVLGSGPDGSWDGLEVGIRPEAVQLWDAGEGVRMNEGGCSPDGVLYVGSMAYDQSGGSGTGRGRVWRLAPSGTVEVARAFGDVTISNGLEWSPDETLAYYVDTPTDRIDVFDWTAEEGLRNRRPFARVEHPDGLTVDASGRVWVARYGGGCVECYGPDGKLEEVVEVGTPRVTACTFGGPGLGELWITTSAEGMSPTDREADPAAGALFRHVPGEGVRGMPVRPYAG